MGPNEPKQRARQVSNPGDSSFCFICSKKIQRGGTRCTEHRGLRKCRNWDNCGGLLRSQNRSGACLVCAKEEKIGRHHGGNILTAIAAKSRILLKRRIYKAIDFLEANGYEVTKKSSA